MIKTCCCCKSEKPFEDFNNEKTQKDGKSRTCRDCRKKQQARYRKNGGGPTPEQYAKYRKNNKSKIARYDIEKRYKKYNITVDDYDLLFQKQNGKCIICGTDDPGRYEHFNIDHCHKTGEIRGLLCTKCNIGLGQLNDDITILKRAIEYLEGKL